jgi:hypothetical protein
MYGRRLLVVLICWIASWLILENLSCSSSASPEYFWRGGVEWNVLVERIEPVTCLSSDASKALAVDAVVLVLSLDVYLGCDDLRVYSL